MPPRTRSHRPQELPFRPRRPSPGRLQSRLGQDISLLLSFADHLPVVDDNLSLRNISFLAPTVTPIIIIAAHAKTATPSKSAITAERGPGPGTDAIRWKRTSVDTLKSRRLGAGDFGIFFVDEMSRYTPSILPVIAVESDTGEVCRVLAQRIPMAPRSLLVLEELGG